MNKLLLGACTLILACQLSAQTNPKREMRGAWIATFAKIDWPQGNTTVTSQKNFLISILDHHKQTGINTIYLQVRSQCDAMYPSALEPWSADLTSSTGIQGIAPSPFWDPLQFAIDESHKRGMELHAWINPYRAISTTDNLTKFAASHVVKQHPEWLLAQGKERILNPGLPAVRNHVTAVITDILKRYDVDGIHFDDYFYTPPPTLASGIQPFNDDSTYMADPRGFPATTTGRGDWRRDNVNMLVKRIYDSVLAIKPWVKFGISPSGIYRSSTNPSIGSPTSAGAFQHYSSVYADSKKWLQMGWVDYIEPQVYWFIGQAGSDYAALVPWWNNNAFGRHIYIGLAGYKVNDPNMGVNWANPSQIPNQVKMNRNALYPNIEGQAVYNTSSMRSTTRLGFRDSLRLNYYKTPCLQPAMPWRDATPPAPASGLTATRYGNDSVVLKWTRPAATTNQMDRARQFAIYRSPAAPIDMNDARNLLAVTNTDTTAFADKTTTPASKYYYAVVSLDRFHNEAAPSALATNLPPAIQCPAATPLTLDSSCVAYLPDYRQAATVANHSGITQFPAPGTVIGSGATSVMLVATDDAGIADSCSFVVNTLDTHPPVIVSCATDYTVSTDAGKCFATLNPGSPAAFDACGALQLSGTRSDNKPLLAVYPKGITTIEWTATDASGNTAVCTQTITVTDNEPPVITAASVNPPVLHAPNHKMHMVTVSYTVTDNCGTVQKWLTVSSNEPGNGLGDGDTAPDWEILNGNQVKLRAERSGNGNGRVYTITIHATDASGNTTTKTVTVTVPHHGAVTMAGKRGDVRENIAAAFTIEALPNPARLQFVLRIKSSTATPVHLRVVDATGRIVEQRFGVPANGNITLGAHYRPGSYRVEISQGKEKRTVQVVKLAE